MSEVALATAPMAAGASSAVLASEAYAYHEPWLRTRRQDYGDDVRQRLLVGAFVSAADYLKGQRVRTLMRDEVDHVLGKLDVLACAATPDSRPGGGRRRRWHSGASESPCGRASSATPASST